MDMEDDEFPYYSHGCIVKTFVWEDLSVGSRFWFLWNDGGEMFLKISESEHARLVNGQVSLNGVVRNRELKVLSY
jgi:hypothetical protein